MISMSVRFPRRSRTCRPVVPASPSMKTFLVANKSTTRVLDDAAEGANAETPGATAATAAKKARDDGDSFIVRLRSNGRTRKYCRNFYVSERGMNESIGMQPCMQIHVMQVRRSSKQKQDLIITHHAMPPAMPPRSFLPYSPYITESPTGKPSRSSGAARSRLSAPPRPGARWRVAPPCRYRRDSRTSCSRSIYTFSTSSRGPSRSSCENVLKYPVLLLPPSIIILKNAFQPA